MKVLDVPSSGSVAGTTHSRNRFGQYVRSRAIPVNPNSTFQGTQRGRLAASAAAWRTLTAAQRAGWNDLAAGFTRTNSLGQPYNMTGFMCYCSCNNNQAAAGNAALSDAPALVTPGALTFGAITLTAAAFSIIYAPTPLGAGARVFTYVSLQRSAGRAFEGDYRLLQVSAAAAASPVNAYAAYVARFGVPIVGNRIFMALRQYLGGFLSGPVVTSQVVA
jgi:hypothetical protein